MYGLEGLELGIDLGLEEVEDVGNAVVLTGNLLVFLKGVHGQEGNQEAGENNNLHLYLIRNKNQWTSANLKLQLAKSSPITKKINTFLHLAPSKYSPQSNDPFSSLIFLEYSPKNTQKNQDLHIETTLKN